jgi:hypothetical protein
MYSSTVAITPISSTAIPTMMVQALGIVPSPVGVIVDEEHVESSSTFAPKVGPN